MIIRLKLNYLFQSILYEETILFFYLLCVHSLHPKHIFIDYP